jgi:5-methylthioribose kinase
MNVPTTGAASLLSFARDEGLFPAGANLRCEEIGDGNVNFVYRLRDQDDGKSLILKHAVPYLRCVGESYPLSSERATREADALEIQARYTPDHVPKVIRRYDPLGIIVMEDLGSLRVMRHEMLKLVKFPRFADDLATFMAALAFHTSDLAAKGAVKKLRERQFVNPELCRIQEDLIFTEPFYDSKNNVVNPRLRPYLETTFWRRDDVRLAASTFKYKFMTERQSLIHGDLHTGSIFVDQKRTVVFDPEFAFFGPTAFDLGKLLGNLVINYFCWSGRDVELAARDDYRRYLVRTMIDLHKGFESKFSQHWESSKEDMICDVRGYREQYQRDLFTDAVGFCGIVMIRRMHGLARNIDVEGIVDEERRARVQTAVLEAASHMLMQRSSFHDVEDVTRKLPSFLP